LLSKKHAQGARDQQQNSRVSTDSENDFQNPPPKKKNSINKPHIVSLPFPLTRQAATRHDPTRKLIFTT
jgi:hypothetical protein